MNDEQYIDMAIEISKKVKYPYGAIVVKDKEIIGRSDAKTLKGYKGNVMAIESYSFYTK